jgi:hypothetical protein
MSTLIKQKRHVQKDLCMIWRINNRNQLPSLPHLRLNHQQAWEANENIQTLYFYILIS